MIRLMIYAILAITGLAFGSFVNAFVWRIHQKHFAKKKASYSVVTGRSMCSSCKHQLSTNDLIPIISWLVLRGKCRYCSQKIEDSPVSEVITPLLFLLSYNFWPFAFTNLLAYVTFFLWLIIIVVIVSLIVFDIRWMLLPDKLTIPLVALSLFFSILRIITTDDYTFIGAILGSMILFLLFFLLYRFSKGGWVGGGDVKLAVSLGLLAGNIELSLILVFIASLLGLLSVIPGIFLGKVKGGLKTRIPFGPYLLSGGVIVVLFGLQAQYCLEKLLYTPIF